MTISPSDAGSQDVVRNRNAATELRSSARIRRGERGIWQRRFWEHTIRDDVDYANHLDYVHFNPVKHGLVERVGDWQFSSFHRCVAQGLYPAEWTCRRAEPDELGERH
jgi:putative transposase